MVETYDRILEKQAKRLRADVADRASGKPPPNYVPTGFLAFDAEYGGLRVGIITEVLMHTGDGKSALFRQLAESAARAGKGVLWFVAEDPEDATAERQFAGDTGIPSTQLGRLDLDDAELRRVDDVARAAAPWAARILPYFEPVDVNRILGTVDGVRAVGGAPLGLVLIDYIQLLAPSEQLESEIARLGVELHARARDRRFAVAAGSQVKTAALQRGRDGWYDRKDISRVRPSLGDTEWCTRFEKLCKCVLAGVRPGRWINEFGGEAVDDHAELHVVKSNFGPMGWIPLRWNGPGTRFENP